MKMKLLAVLIVVMLAVAGCSSSGTKSSTAEQDKISTINSMMSKGYEMSKSERQKLNKMLADGQELIKQGKTAEANKLLDEAIKKLEVLAETDRFNKSE